MSYSFSSFCSIVVISFIIFLTFSLCFFIPIFSYNPNTTFYSEASLDTSLVINSNCFIWPTPGYTTITSNFGYRNSPITGASSYHSGIDIGAPTGSNIIAVFSGVVIYTGFSGSGGYTIRIKNDNFTVSYCHVSPHFSVYVGEYVIKGKVIGKVGPKNVYGVYNNPYKDSNGNPTNGASTGPHLHLTLKKDGKAINPLIYIK